MAIDPGQYEGRAQAIVKHTFLSKYLPALVGKLGNSRDRLVYIDGFAGPWKSSDEENFSDTSFGIALDAMLAAQQFQKNRGHNVKMTAHLVEKDPAAFQKLDGFAKQFDTINVTPREGDFHGHMQAILNSLQPSDFCFTFIDPKGLSLDIKALSPLLARRSSEVLINFMYDFFNRLAGMDSEAITEIMNALMLGAEWRPKLEAARNPKEREEVIIEAFCECVRTSGNYKYVTTLKVQKPSHDRTLYHLVFGTRHPAGLEVFRDSQIKALETQAQVRSTAKTKAKSKKSGMDDMFGGSDTVALDPSAREIEAGKIDGVKFARALIASRSNGILWPEIWPAVLEKHTIRKSVLGNSLNELRKAGSIIAPDWPSERQSQPRDGQKFLSIEP